MDKKKSEETVIFLINCVLAGDLTAEDTKAIKKENRKATFTAVNGVELCADEVKLKDMATVAIAYVNQHHGVIPVIDPELMPLK